MNQEIARDYAPPNYTKLKTLFEQGLRYLNKLPDCGSFDANVGFADAELYKARNKADYVSAQLRGGLAVWSVLGRFGVDKMYDEEVADLKQQLELAIQDCAGK